MKDADHPSFVHSRRETVIFCYRQAALKQLLFANLEMRRRPFS
jgi:hypothetical protein